MLSKGGGGQTGANTAHPFTICRNGGGIQQKGGGGGGLKGAVWLGPPSSEGPRMVPAEREPKIFKLKCSWHLSRNYIAFGSAPRREADSQLDKPAISQTQTHTLGFLSVADTGPSSGENN